MNEIKFLYFSDPHLTAKGPSSRKDVYYRTTFDKMTEVGEIAKKEGADLILCGGDLFHSPVVSLNYAGRIAQIMKSWGKPIFVVPGNHDEFGYNISTINQTMLGMFARTNIIKLLTSDAPLRIKVGTKSLSIEGREYSNVIDKNPENYEPLIRNTDLSIVVNHGMLLDKEYIPGIPYTMTKDVEYPADITLGGHYHYGFKEHEVNGGMFFNPGSLLRTEASTGNKTFVPKVMIFDIQDGGTDIGYTYKYIPLTVALDSKEIFDFSSIQQKKDTANLLDQFKQFVVNTSSITGTSSVEDMIEDVSIENQVDQDVTLEALDRVQKSHTNDVDSLQARGFIENTNKLSIVKLDLENFQSHQHSVVDFGDGFNVIVGETNSGKTSILRALQWVLYNEPKGSDFIRTGADRCTVTLELSDGHKIARTRSRDSAGEYSVTNPSGTTEVYRGFGTNLPIEIFNAHQMPLVELTKGTSISLNVASQLEGPFLISMNPSEKANAIGRIIGSQVLDNAIKDVSRDVTALNREVSTYKKQLESKEKEKLEYDFLPDFKLKIDEADFLLKESKTAQDEITDLVYVSGNYQMLVVEIEDLIQKLSRYDMLDKLEKSIPKLDLVHRSLQDMILTDEDYKKTEGKVTALSGKLDSLFDVSKAEKTIDALIKEQEEKSVLQKNLDRYVKAEKEVDRLQTKMSTLKIPKDKDIKSALKIDKEIEQLTGLVLLYEEKFMKAENASDRFLKKEIACRELDEKLEKERSAFTEFLVESKFCPLCETPLDDHAISHIIGEN